MSMPFAQASFPEVYERVLVGPLFRPFVELTLDVIGLREGARVLDVACGTGTAARVARERAGAGARIVGVDANAGMLGVASTVAPDIEWRTGDASALPLQPGEQFDVVVCHQGFQFFADRVAAAREMARALAPGGRIAVATWRPDEEVPLGRALRDVAERRLGPIEDRRHALGRPEETEAALQDAGVSEIRSTVRTHTVRFEDGSLFVRLNAMALVGMAAGAKGIDESERQRLVDVIARESADVMTRFSGGGELSYELGTNITTGRRRA